MCAGLRAVAAECRAGVAYHDSCSSLREMGVKDEPRRLLSSVDGLRLCELKEPQTCCGFGGFFSVKYPDVSARMADDKIADAVGTGAEMLVGGDLGCLLHLSGRMARRGEKLAVRHAAEVMAGFASEPAHRRGQSLSEAHRFPASGTGGARRYAAAERADASEGGLPGQARACACRARRRRGLTRSRARDPCACALASG